MTLVVIFFISGLAILTLIVVKDLEIKRKRSFFITRAISKGDIHARKIYQKTVDLYSEGKEGSSFFFKKRLPIHSRNLFNKLTSFLEEKRQLYIDNMRDSKLLKKSDGISEFFKNMSNIEKGNGEIHDIYENSGSYKEEWGKGSQNK